MPTRVRPAPLRPLRFLCQTATITIWQEGQSNEHARRPLFAVRASSALTVDGFASSRGALQDPHQGKARDIKIPAALGRRRRSGTLQAQGTATEVHTRPPQSKSGETHSYSVPATEVHTKATHSLGVARHCKSTIFPKYAVHGVVIIPARHHRPRPSRRK